MKKSELTSGVVLEARNGGKYILLKDRYFNGYKDVAFSLQIGFIELDSHDEELICQGDHEFDIMKVYQPESLALISNAFKEDFADWTWERKETLELTLEEISKKYGKEVKIVEKH